VKIKTNFKLVCTVYLCIVYKCDLYRDVFFRSTRHKYSVLMNRVFSTKFCIIIILSSTNESEKKIKLLVLSSCDTRGFCLNYRGMLRMKFFLFFRSLLINRSRNIRLLTEYLVTNIMRFYV